MKISDLLINNVIYIIILFLILSALTYNYFYFLAIGIDISSIPISLIDYINNMQWYWIVSFIIYLIYIEIPLRKIEGFKTEEELIKTSKNPEKFRKIPNQPYKFLCIISIIIIITFLVKKIFSLNILLNDEGIGISVFVVTLCLLDWVLRSENISRRIIVIILVLYFLTIIGAWGYFNGINANNKKIKDILILNDNKKIHCAILRNFNDVILIRDINSYMFVSKSDIKAIKY